MSLFFYIKLSLHGGNLWDQVCRGQLKNGIWNEGSISDFVICSEIGSSGPKAFQGRHLVCVWRTTAVGRPGCICPTLIIGNHSIFQRSLEFAIKPKMLQKGLLCYQLHASLLLPFSGQNGSFLRESAGHCSPKVWRASPSSWQYGRGINLMNWEVIKTWYSEWHYRSSICFTSNTNLFTIYKQ